MAKFQSDLTRSSALRRFWNFTKMAFISGRVIIASAFRSYLRNFARPYSCRDQVVTHTQTHKLTTITLRLRSG